MVVALLLVAAFIYLTPNIPALLKHLTGVNSQTATTATTETYPQNFTVYSPAIENGSASVSYPPNYGALADYSLQLINQDRANHSLSPVSLGSGRVAQQHADSMLKYDYFSHFDTQGYKPYMRYTLLGGLGAVFENVAYANGGRSLDLGGVERDIKLLEHLMMYNDSICCNNGHRINILNPLHNIVGVGVAYNSSTVYFVEDFESDYINMSFSASPNYVVSMRGAVTSPGVNSTEAFVTFDPTPAPESRQQLNSGPHEYDPGTNVGGVLPPCTSSCPVFTQGVTVHASSWQFTSTQVDIDFSLAKLIGQSGPGVYTIYLVAGSDFNSAITSISVFVAQRSG